MLKKECSDVLKQIIFFTLTILLLPAFLIITTIIPDQSYFSVFFPVFQFGLFFWALFMGASLLSVERGQRGMEYLLSLPYSRLQLLGLKIVPRLIAFLIFFLVFLILYKSGGEDVAALSFYSFTLIYFSLYLIALSFSASSDNFVVQTAVSVFCFFIYLNLLFLAYWLVLLKNGIPVYRANISYLITGEYDPFLPGIPIAAFVLLLPFLITLFFSFKKFDIRPAKVYNKRYFKFFTPIFIIGFIISFLFVYLGTDIGHKYYYLTRDQKLIESHNYKTKIYERDKVHKIKGQFDFSWPSQEENEYVYARHRRKIIRLNTSDYIGEVLYDAPTERDIAWQFWKYDQTIAFLERKRNKHFSDVQLVLIDETSKEVTRIPLEYSFPEKSYWPILIGTDKIDGKRFWLICSEKNWKTQILRLWEDGTIENIGKSLKRPFYRNRMLITYSEQEVIISREKEGRFETVQKIPNSKGFHFGFGYWGSNLNNLTLKELYGWKRASKNATLKYARLNLENFEIEEIGEFKGYLRCLYPDDYYLVETDHVASMVKVYKWKEGKLKLLKNFTDYDTTGVENRFRLCKGGVVIREGRKVRAYGFPDLKKLKFKKL